MTDIENKNITRLDLVQKLANKNLPMHKWYISRENRRRNSDVFCKHRGHNSDIMMYTFVFWDEICMQS
jgi:hypothetical protein